MVNIYNNRKGYLTDGTTEMATICISAGRGFRTHCFHAHVIHLSAEGNFAVCIEVQRAIPHFVSIFDKNRHFPPAPRSADNFQSAPNLSSSLWIKETFLANKEPTTVLHGVRGARGGASTAEQSLSLTWVVRLNLSILSCL